MAEGWTTGVFVNPYLKKQRDPAASFRLIF
jgi:hypothetical protein